MCMLLFFTYGRIGFDDVMSMIHYVVAHNGYAYIIQISNPQTTSSIFVRHVSGVTLLNGIQHEE